MRSRSELVDGIVSLRFEMKGPLVKSPCPGPASSQCEVGRLDRLPAQDGPAGLYLGVGPENGKPESGECAGRSFLGRENLSSPIGSLRGGLLWRWPCKGVSGSRLLPTRSFLGVENLFESLVVCPRTKLGLEVAERSGPGEERFDS